MKLTKNDKILLMFDSIPNPKVVSYGAFDEGGYLVILKRHGADRKFLSTALSLAGMEIEDLKEREYEFAGHYGECELPDYVVPIQNEDLTVNMLYGKEQPDDYYSVECPDHHFSTVWWQLSHVIDFVEKSSNGWEGVITKNGIPILRFDHEPKSGKPVNFKKLR